MSLAPLASDAAEPQRVPAPVFIPSGTIVGVHGVSRVDIHGNSRDQLDELIRQCGIRGVLDLGKGWQAADPKAMFWGQYSADPDLDWPAFEAGPDEDGKLPTIREVLAAFFRDRPAYRWRIDKRGLVWIEPTDAGKRTGWVLRRRFKKPVISDVDAKHGWVIPHFDVEEAVKAAFPEWRRSRTEFSISRNICGITPPFEVYSPRETSVSSLGELIELWLHARPHGFAVLEGGMGGSETPGPHPIGSVEVDEWQPFRHQTATLEIVGNLKEGAKMPDGYIWTHTWYEDCYRELERRHHFQPDEVVQAIIESDIGAEFAWPDWRADFFNRLDKQRLGKFLHVCYKAAALRDKIAGRTVSDPSPETFEEADYVRYWKHLAASDDLLLAKIGKARLEKK